MARWATYTVRLAPTAQTAAKTLLQVKAGNAALELVRVKAFQTNKTASEQWEMQVLRKSAAATVTSFTPLKMDPNDPTSLAVGGTAATGTNASAEGTDGDILDDDGWNIINGAWLYLPVPDDRIWVPPAGIIAVKLNTAPAASTTIGIELSFNEYL